jgi:nucleoside-diphosphate-sugar epimerase
MRVLVTGHTGYIGSVMTPILLKEGFDVVGLDTDLFLECTFGERGVDVPSIKKDLRDVELHDLEGFEAIIHLAGLSNDPLGNLNPNLTYEINHLASVRLAELAKQVGVPRFLFSSSCSIYGAAAQDAADETATFNPITPYGKSKELVERDVAPLADANFSPVFMRNATAYGVSPRMRFDLVVNNLVAWAFTTGALLIKSDGTPWRPLIHIVDISTAFVAALRVPRDVVHSKAFNVGQNSENYQVRDLANIASGVVPNSRVDYAPGGEPDLRCYRADFSKIARELPEWKAKWNVRKGAEQCYEAYRHFGIKLEDFEGQRYRRIDHIKRLLASCRLDSSLRWTDVPVAA